MAILRLRFEHPSGAMCRVYIESLPNRDSPPTVLLREPCREDGKVRERTLVSE